MELLEAHSSKILTFTL